MQRGDEVVINGDGAAKPIPLPTSDDRTGARLLTTALHELERQERHDAVLHVRHDLVEDRDRGQDVVVEIGRAHV